MAKKQIHQNQPGQICGHLNTWTYALIAVATGADEQTAKDAAKGEAETQAQQQLTAERNRRTCPGNCRDGERLKGRKKPALKHIHTYEDSDRNLWVSYYSARWHVQLECKKQQPKLAHVFTVGNQSLAEAGNNPACGETRFYSGCSLGFGSGTNAARAKAAAVAEAQRVANIALDRAKAKACPAGCRPGQKAANDQAISTELEAYRIYQVTPTTYVAYATAHWVVSTTCPAKEEKGGKKKLRRK